MIKEMNLRQFTGTLNWYKHPFGLLYTDGIKYLADQAKAYWLIDLVASYQPKCKNIPFQLWKITIDKNNSAVITMKEDLNKKNEVRQDIPYTDFPMKDFEFYVCDNTMLLKSEY